MKLGTKQELFAYNISKLLEFAHSLGFSVRFGEATRPQMVQDEYLRTGRTKVKYSQHQKKLAMDLYIFLGGKWIQDKESLQVLGDYWESLNENNRWGGNWTSFYDAPHFEMQG